MFFDCFNFRLDSLSNSYLPKKPFSKFRITKSKSGKDQPPGPDVNSSFCSVAVRKQDNVCEYYRQYVGQQLQDQIDKIIENFEIKVKQ